MEKQTIKFANGSDFSFDGFDPKETNLIKINLNEDGSDNGEGIWACISEEDKVDHDNDVNDHGEYKRVATLRNTSFQFAPLIWGTYIMYTMNGEHRPVCDVSKFDFSGELVSNMTETIGK